MKGSEVTDRYRINRIMQDWCGQIANTEHVQPESLAEFLTEMNVELHQIMDDHGNMLDKKKILKQK